MMPVQTGPYLDTKDVYIDYPLEEVMFRRMKDSGAIYLKFYQEPELANVIDNGHDLYRDAIRYGEEITQVQYDRGYDSRPSWWKP